MSKIRYKRDDIVEAYAKYKSIRAVARNLRISPTTVQKYLKGTPKAPPGAPIKSPSWEVRFRSKVHRWFVMHRDDDIPQNLTALAQMSGFPKPTVAKYIRRRHEALSYYLKTLGSLRDVYVVMTSEKGERVPSNFIYSYDLKLNKYTLTVTITAVMTVGGTRVIHEPLSVYIGYFKGRSRIGKESDLVAPRRHPTPPPSNPQTALPQLPSRNP